MEPFKKKFSPENIPDLSQKVIIVTGGATGIGKETVTQLLRRNARVYIASRSQKKFQELLEELSDLDDIQSSLKFLELNLSDMKSCIRAAKQFKEMETRLDVVVANAALSVMPETLTTDGIEIQFGTNHLGHFAFIYNLLDLIKQTSKQFSDARIVVVASHAHAMYKPVPGMIIDFDSLGVEGLSSIRTTADVQASLQRYARSKLANILFARALHRRLQETGHSNVFVNCLNPGTIGTSAGTDSAALPPWIAILSSLAVRVTSIPVQDGARTILLLATDQEIATRKLSGRYFDVGPLSGKFWYEYSWDATEAKISDAARNEELMEMLWKWSMDMMELVM
ncbi:putative carbonyl reductase [Aaosphaeria arxii CBS 175.79]|uniref:Putative carbonyl reductase n=1 Tax=Aaosphaeria arxii CBS 175.79 TaxID=1450172 RepID=A0A6A5XSV0_9PLEO|nr:putative carbonyl reductase [Aaosphaeria arxii CBS 175.79]KAF2015996.1 putative carbonyl reductase [Aaosphaeria arxii CBS 175.79]